MTPAQFLAKLKRREIGPAYLFLGAESYDQRRLKQALLEAVPGVQTEYDLSESSLVEVIDDARSLSLFAHQRVIVAANAEAALPRQKMEEAQDAEIARGTAGPLVAYLKDPSPGVVLLFLACRYEFEGDDKRKLERVQKFYSMIPETVELRRYQVEDARREAQAMARRAGLSIDSAALDFLVECLGADLMRIQVEIEKLSLYRGLNGSVTVDQIAATVPDARTTTMFALVNALGRRDRARGLHILDTLCREGEYLPLALAFLSTQFRLALVAKEAALRSAQQVQSHFTRIGVPVWSSRAEQIFQTASKFSKPQLEHAIQLIFEADRGLRDARPDDRILMERFVFELTA